MANSSNYESAVVTHYNRRDVQDEIVDSAKIDGSHCIASAMTQVGGHTCCGTEELQNARFP